jgi:hypothetical protein
MWETHFDMPAPNAWPAAAGFTVSLGVVAALTALGLHDQSLGLIALAAGAAVCSWSARRGAALAVGAIAWLFDNGFVRGDLGQLHWQGLRDVGSLVALLTVGLVAARLGPDVLVERQPDSPAYEHQELVRTGASAANVPSTGTGNRR